MAKIDIKTVSKEPTRRVTYDLTDDQGNVLVSDLQVPYDEENIWDEAKMAGLALADAHTKRSTYLDTLHQRVAAKQAELNALTAMITAMEGQITRKM